MLLCFRTRLNNFVLSRTLVQAFPEAGLGVSVAADGCIYQSEVYTASSSPTSTTSTTTTSNSNPRIGSPNSNGRKGKGKNDRGERGERGWGGRAVLVLVGIRLGLEGVNPVYYDTIKVRSLRPCLFFPFCCCCGIIIHVLCGCGTDIIHVPTIGGHSGRPTFLLVLLRWIAG